MLNLLNEAVNKSLNFKNLMELLTRTSSTAYGWFLSVIFALANSFAPEWYAFTVVLAAVLMDAFFGIMVSIKKHSFTLSRLGRVTTVKIASYSSALVMVFLIEKIAHDTGLIGVKLAAAWAAACEFWSMSASILIIWPDAYFFRLIRKQLKGEIAHKLGKNVDDIFKEDE